MTLIFERNFGASIAPGQSFARGSIATYFGKSGAMLMAPNDAPRFDANGLLLEPMASNVYDAGEGFSNWSLSNVARAQGRPAPDGTLTGDRITALNSGAGERELTRSTVGVSVGQEATISVFVSKTYGHRYVKLFGFGNGALGVAFDLLTGQSQVNGTWVEAGTQDFGDFWRLWGRVIPATSTLGAFGFATNLNGVLITPPNDTDTWVDIWGYNAVPGSLLTSYIPSGGRAADALGTINLTAPINQGTIVFAARPAFGQTVTGGALVQLVGDIGPSQNSVQIRSVDAFSHADVIVRQNSTTSADTTGPNVFFNQRVVWAFAFSDNDFRLSRNGEAVHSYGSTSLSPTVDRIVFPSPLGPMYIDYLAIYDTPLSNAQLEAESARSVFDLDGITLTQADTGLVFETLVPTVNVPDFDVITTPASLLQLMSSARVGPPRQDHRVSYPAARKPSSEPFA